MPAPHDPAALSLELAAVPPAGAPVAVRADAARLGFPERNGAPARGDEFDLVGSVRLDGRIERLPGEGFRLRGHLAGAARLDCARCLDPVDHPLAEALDLVYLPGLPPAPEPGAAPAGRRRPEADEESSRRRPSANAAGETELDADDLNVSFYGGDRLELTETLREQVQLALPVKPLCSPTCRGLCPSCGENRNAAEECRCAEARPEVSSPSSPLSGPLSGLAALRDLPGLVAASRPASPPLSRRPD